MPSYGPWTWSQPHKRHYSYWLADDGITVLDTLWAGPATGPATAETTPAARAHENSARSVERYTFKENVARSIDSTPRTGGDLPIPLSQHRSHPSSGSSLGTNATTWPLARTHHSQPNDSRSSSRLLHGSTGSAYDSRRGEADNYRQQQYGHGTRVDGSRDARSAGLNYTTAPYGSTSPQSYPSAHASMTTASAGSPYPQQNYQTQNSYPFTPTSPKQSQHATPSGATGQLSQYPATRRSVASLPVDVQSTIQSLDRRYIQTSYNESSNHEQLDTRYRRVAQPSRPTFFVRGRVFKMLWTEPAGQVNLGKTRNSTHFSTVQYGETAFSEIRRFVVVRNKGEFSQCIPIQTYRGRGAAKPGLRMRDHGVIHTTKAAPNLLAGEILTKYPIPVQSTEGEYLEPESRVNYGKAYAVEHNVKVLDVGMVIEGYRYLIKEYFDAAMQGD